MRQRASGLCSRPKLGGPSVPRRSIASATFDVRRSRNKRLWKEPAPSTEPEYILFPQERLGNQVDLNWSLCRIGMPPIGDAYRNLHLRALVSLASGTMDANKTLHAQTTEARTLVLAKAGTEHRTLARNIKQELGSAPSIFVHDASFATAPLAPLTVMQQPANVILKPSAPGGKPFINPAPPAQRLGPPNPNHVRIVTDNVHTAIVLHHMMPSARLGDPWQFVAGATLLHLTAMTASGSVGSVGSKVDDFFVYNNDAGEALLNGGIQHVLETIALAGATRLWPHAVPIRAALDTDRNLYVGSAAQLASVTASLGRAGKLAAAHQVYWSEKGITAAFRGALLPVSSNAKTGLGRGDINFANIGRAVFRLPSQRGLFGHPAKLVLLSDKGTKASVSAADVVAQVVGKDGVLSAHMPAFDRVAPVDVKAVSEKLHSLLKLAGTTVHVSTVDKIAT